MRYSVTGEVVSATYSYTFTTTLDNRITNVRVSEEEEPPFMSNILSTKQGANKFSAETYGVKAYFYKPEDLAQLKRLMVAYGIAAKSVVDEDSFTDNGLEFNLDTLHTYHPAINVPPMDELYAFRPSDKFGFMRMGVTGAFLRPHFKNVQSCHRFNAPTEVRAPFGNLSYMANAWWSTYAIYKRVDSSVEYVYDTVGVENPKELGIPNLVATVNVLFGYDNDGIASAMLSRVYGVLNHEKNTGRGEPVLYRLVEYLQHRLGLRVYGSAKWIGTYHDQFGGSIKLVSSNKYRVTSPRVPAQFYATDPSNPSRKTVVFRYPDIVKPKLRWDAGQKSLWVVESHECYQVFSNVNIGGQCSIFSPSMNPEGTAMSTYGYYEQAGYRPGRDQILSCSKCHVDNESGNKIVIRAYAKHGTLCNNCAAEVMVMSSRLGTYIDRETAIQVATGRGRTDYYRAEEDKALYVGLSAPDKQTGCRFADYSTVTTVTAIANLSSNKPRVEDITIMQDSVENDYRQVSCIDLGNVLNYLNADINNVKPSHNDEDEHSLYYRADLEKLYHRWLDSNNLRGKITFEVDDTKPVYAVSVEGNDVDGSVSTYKVTLSNGETLNIDVPRRMYKLVYTGELVGTIISEYLEAMQFVIKKGYNNSIYVKTSVDEIKGGKLRSMFTDMYNNLAPLKENTTREVETRTYAIPSEVDIIVQALSAILPTSAEDVTNHSENPVPVSTCVSTVENMVEEYVPVEAAKRMVKPKKSKV